MCDVSRGGCAPSPIPALRGPPPQHTVGLATWFRIRRLKPRHKDRVVKGRPMSSESKRSASPGPGKQVSPKSAGSPRAVGGVKSPAVRDPDLDVENLRPSKRPAHAVASRSRPLPAAPLAPLADHRQSGDPRGKPSSPASASAAMGTPIQVVGAPVQVSAALQWPFPLPPPFPAGGPEPGNLDPETLRQLVFELDWSEDEDKGAQKKSDDDQDQEEDEEAKRNQNEHVEQSSSSEATAGADSSSRSPKHWATSKEALVRPKPIDSPQPAASALSTPPRPASRLPVAEESPLAPGGLIPLEPGRLRPGPVVARGRYRWPTSSLWSLSEDRRRVGEADRQQEERLAEAAMRWMPGAPADGKAAVTTSDFDDSQSSPERPPPPPLEE